MFVLRQLPVGVTVARKTVGIARENIIFAIAVKLLIILGCAVGIFDETAAQRIITDPHSPGLYRVNGPLSNIEDFYKAFNVNEKDAMYRPDSLRAKIW